MVDSVIGVSGGVSMALAGGIGFTIQQVRS
jgi:hypothetical protein